MLSLVHLRIWVNLNENNGHLCVRSACFVSYFIIPVIIICAFIIITGLHSVMISLDYRDCTRNNNNNDLLKYASLIIITDNRESKRDRPLTVKHSFVVEFLTSRIFNIILPETLITALLKSPAISRDTHRKRVLPLSNYRYSDENLVCHFSP